MSTDGKFFAAELAKHFEVSVRTIQRDEGDEKLLQMLQSAVKNKQVVKFSYTNNSKMHAKLQRK